MKLAFIFDVRFVRYKEHYYSINLSQEFWTKRYLKIYDEIEVIGRYTEVNADPTGKLVLSDNDQVHFRCIKDINPVKRVFNSSYESKFIKDVIRECDSVICRGWWGVNECIEMGKNYLIESVSCAWDAYWNHGLLGKIAAPYEYYRQKKAIKSAPYVIYVTSKFLQNRYPTSGKTTNISNVLLSEDAGQEVLNYRINKIKNRKDEDDLIIGTAAAVDVKYKGQEFVIKAIAILKKKGINNVRYCMIGAGKTDYLQSIARKYDVMDKIEIIGPIPHKNVNSWLDMIDIYVQPSLQEGLPRSLIEAMSRGIPAIGSKTGGIPELLDDECVCKSNHRMEHKIAGLLEHLKEKDVMLKYAARNFQEAKNYNGDILEKRRYEFLLSFANHN